MRWAAVREGARPRLTSRLSSRDIPWRSMMARSGVGSGGVAGRLLRRWKEFIDKGETTYFFVTLMHSTGCS